MELQPYIAFFIFIGACKLTYSTTSTPATTVISNCYLYYMTDISDPCEQGLFFITPEISKYKNDPTPIVDSDLKSFSITPGNSSCQYDIQWSTPQGMVDQLDGNVLPGANKICAVNEFYTACGFIFLISPTTEITEPSSDQTISTSAPTYTSTFIPSTASFSSTFSMTTVLSTSISSTEISSNSPSLETFQTTDFTTTPSSTTPVSTSTISTYPSTLKIEKQSTEASVTNSEVSSSSSVSIASKLPSVTTYDSTLSGTTVSKPVTPSSSIGVFSSTSSKSHVVTATSSEISPSPTTESSISTVFVSGSERTASASTLTITSNGPLIVPTTSVYTPSSSVTSDSPFLSSSITDISSSFHSNIITLPTVTTISSSKSIVSSRASSTAEPSSASVQTIAPISSSSTSPSSQTIFFSKSPSYSTAPSSTDIPSTVFPTTPSAVVMSSKITSGTKPTSSGKTEITQDSNVFTETSLSDIPSTLISTSTSKSSTIGSLPTSKIDYKSSTALALPDNNTSSTISLSTSFLRSTTTFMDNTASSSLKTHINSLPASTTQSSRISSTLATVSSRGILSTHVSTLHMVDSVPTVRNTVSSQASTKNLLVVSGTTDIAEVNTTSGKSSTSTTLPTDDTKERKENELISKKIKELVISRNSSSSDIIDKMINSDKKELIEFIRNQVAVSSQTQDMDIHDYINNMTSANEELAKAIESILSDMEKVSIKTPNVMFDLLDNMERTIEESNGFTIDPTQKSGDQYGSYIAEYGVVNGENINLVLHACSVTVEGKNVFLSGNIIPSKVTTENKPTFLKYFSDGTVEMNGEFQNFMQVSVAKASFSSRGLADSLSVVHFHGDPEIHSGLDEFNPSLVFGIELWNASLSRVSGLEQIQKNVTLTAFANIENLQLTLLLTKSSLSKLLDGIPHPTISCSFRMTMQEKSYAIELGEGIIGIQSIHGSELSIVYDGNDIKATPNLDEIHKFLHTPVHFKNIDMNWLESKDIGKTTLKLNPVEQKSLNIDVMIPGANLPPVMQRLSPINRTSLTIISPYSLDVINTVLKNGGTLTVEGQIWIGNTIIEILKKVAKVDGKMFEIELAENNTLSLTDVLFELQKTSSKPILLLLSGQYIAPAIPHYRTEFNFDGKGRMSFTGGTLLRNQTNGIILSGATLQVSKDFSATSFDIIPQSLFTQKSYEYLTTTMSNINDYLQNNSNSLTNEELNKSIGYILDTTSSLISSLQSSAKSPLPSDIAVNLLNEKNNYNDLFNILPENPDDIRYVEEMTEDEWAAEATSIVQKKMTAQVLNTLIDTIATRKIKSGEYPFMVEFTGSGMQTILAAGLSGYVLNKTFSCEKWEINFPSSIEDLNISLAEDEIIRADVVCYNSNNYYFVDDHQELVDSGSVDIKLKTSSSEVIDVKQTRKPIVLLGKLDNDNIYPLIPLASNTMDENQILDFRSFIVSAWNISLTIEIQFSKVSPDEEKVLFLGYQAQPGPRFKDHEYLYKYNSSNDQNRFFVSSDQLNNMTGMFILGVGSKVRTNGTVVYDEADMPIAMTEPYQFKKESSEFRARILTKGCYAYNNETNRFESYGILPINTPSSTRVTCHSNHLTSFFVGIKNPEIAAKYSFEFTVDVVPKNVQPVLLIVAYSMFLLITFFNCCTMERLDEDRGELKILKDNHPADDYLYIMSVFTGFRQFSSSQSKIAFNITGEAASEMGRCLETDNVEKSQLLKWGTCTRFLLRTHWSLGDLKYLRLWIEQPGEEQSEAWFCTKVVLYDIQAEKKFIFPVHSWLGRTNGDGQTERLCRVDSSINLLDESISLHNILEQITYIVMFLGGTGLSRARLERDVYILSLWISLSIITTLLGFTTHVFSDNRSSNTVLDAVAGVSSALLLLITNMMYPYIAKNSYTNDENEKVKYYKAHYENYIEPKGQLNPVLKSIVATIIKTMIMILLIVNTVKCFSLSEQYANIFTRRFLIMLLSWIAVLEPFKAVLVCMGNIKKNRTYQVTTSTELSFLPVTASHEFQKCPEEIVDKETGSTYADLSKLRATKDNRMRDEILFHTVREIVFLLFSLTIFVSLTYLLRDRFGYYYQNQIKNSFNLESSQKSFSNIKNVRDFWDWADSSLVNGLMVDWPDGDPAYDMRGFIKDKASRSMGTGIIRQVRSIPHQCDFVLPEGSSQSTCAEDIWEAGYETTEQFDPSWLPNTNSSVTEYTYRSSEFLQSSSIMGQLATYKGGGYVVSLQGNKNVLRERFQRLRNESWIDKETRAVFVELSLYNAQINYFCVIQLLLEIPRTKLFLPTAWVESMRLIRGDDDTMNQIIELIYICYCLLKFALEFYCIVRDRFNLLERKSFFHPIRLLKHLLIGSYDLWQTMDFFVGLMSMASVITYMMKIVYVKEAVDIFLETNGNTYINLSKQRDVELMFTYSFAIVVFFISCKLIKILRFNHRIGVLADTLESATTGISDYGQAFLCVLNAFILAMMHLLGNTLEGYYSYIVSLQTLVSSLLGKLGGGKVYDTSSLGTTYFLLFMFLGTVLLLNVFVMIIMYEFEIVRTNADRLANNYEIIEHISYKVKNKCGMLERSNKISVALEDQYCEAPLLQLFMRKIYQAIYRTNRLHNMNKLNRKRNRTADIESMPDVLMNATVLRHIKSAKQQGHYHHQ